MICTIVERQTRCQYASANLQQAPPAHRLSSALGPASAGRAAPPWPNSPTPSACTAATPGYTRIHPGTGSLPARESHRQLAAALLHTYTQGNPAPVGKAGQTGPHTHPAGLRVPPEPPRGGGQGDETGWRVAESQEAAPPPSRERRRPRGPGNGQGLGKGMRAEPVTDTTPPPPPSTYSRLARPWRGHESGWGACAGCVPPRRLWRRSVGEGCPSSLRAGCRSFFLRVS